MKNRSELKVLLASYGVPGIYAIEALFSQGFLPEQIALLTYQADSRNEPLCSLAQAYGIEMVEYAAKSKAAVQWVREVSPDLLFSLHYRDRIPLRILELPKMNSVNLHPSLLPKYKGCFSAPWVLINGESETGFSFHTMVEEFDAGKIILQKTVQIAEDETAFSLFHKLIVEAMSCFGEVLDLLIDDEYPGREQVGEGSYYSRDVPYGGVIDPKWEIPQVERFIRAMIFPPFKPALLETEAGLIEISSIEEYSRHR